MSAGGAGIGAIQANKILMKDRDQPSVPVRQPSPKIRRERSPNRTGRDDSPLKL